jgi:hypothetical protein
MSTAPLTRDRPVITAPVSLLPAIHRRAAAAAILGDDRLEIAVDPAGHAAIRVVPGALAPA